MIRAQRKRKLPRLSVADHPAAIPEAPGIMTILIRFRPASKGSYLEHQFAISGSSPHTS